MKAEASERRSQAENRAVAVFRLRVNLALDVRVQREAGSVPSALWQTRLRGEQIVVSAAHEDFPAILAEAMDTLAACEFDPNVACESLRCSVSQLVKLLRKEPRSLAQVNRERQTARRTCVAIVRRYITFPRGGLANQRHLE